ncbi:hypothetical protein H9P43_007551 [Blastocladiella emersonii ATCC 22665]|nr:hypothetical protein H9P43_007551 [Blastocladiella emersonii ATCC 22665]
MPNSSTAPWPCVATVVHTVRQFLARLVGRDEDAEERLPLHNRYQQIKSPELKNQPVDSFSLVSLELRPGMSFAGSAAALDAASAEHQQRVDPAQMDLGLSALSWGRISFNSLPSTVPEQRAVAQPETDRARDAHDARSTMRTPSPVRKLAWEALVPWRTLGPRQWSEYNTVDELPPLDPVAETNGGATASPAMIKV